MSKIGTEADLLAEVAALRAERDELEADLDVARRLLGKAESRKRVLGQVNQLLDDSLFKSTLARRVAEVAERYVDLGEICDAAFGLLKEVVSVRGALVVVDIGDRRALLAHESCPASSREDTLTAWAWLTSGNITALPGSETIPIFRGTTPVAILAVYPAKSTGFTARDREILSSFAEHLRLPLERGAYLERVRDLVDAKESFVRMLTHDLRNPLTSILSSLWVVNSDQWGIDADQQKLLLSNAFRSAQRLNGLLEDLLDLYRHEAGKLKLELDPVDLPGLVREALDQIAPVAAEKGILLFDELPPGVPAVVGDRGKLFRVLANLLSNAIKFTDKGTVTLRAKREGPAVVVGVTDSGPGIPEIERDRIFSKFHQIDSSSTRKKGGTGLGLPITKHIVEGHGGAIWVEGSEGTGSTFAFSLAARLSVPTALDAPLPFSEGQMGAPTILIIDDEPDARTILRTICEAEGYTVYEAGTGAEGLRLARGLKPDLATVDLMMPDIDGFGVIERLKEDPATAQIQAVIISALEREGRFPGAGFFQPSAVFQARRCGAWPVSLSTPRPATTRPGWLCTNACIPRRSPA